MLGIRKTQTTAYHPSGNGQVERFNHTLVKMIKAFLKGEQRNWDLNLGCLAGAYRATMHESTGFTPNLLMFGRENRLPAEILYGVPKQEDSTKYCEFVEEIRGKLEKAHEVTRQHLQKNVSRQKEIYDAKSVMYQYKVGDLVWYAAPVIDAKLAPKLQRSFVGPIVILQRFNDLTYEIQIDAKGSKRVVHHDKLLPYRGREIPKWTKKVIKKTK